MISICFSISRMLNGPTVLLKNSTTSLCNPVINNLSSRSSSSLTSTNNNTNHNDNDQIKPDLSQSSSCLSTTLFTNYSMHPIHNHSIYTTNLSSSINYDNTTTTTTLNHHNQAYQLSDSLKRTHFNCPNDTLFINQIIKDKIKSSEQLTSTIMIKNDDIIQIRRRLPPLGKSDSSETGLQINNNNNSIVTTATKIVIEADPNDKNSNNNDNIGQHKTIEEGNISNEEITSEKMLQSQSDSVNIEHK